VIDIINLIAGRQAGRSIHAWPMNSKFSMRCSFEAGVIFSFSVHCQRRVGEPLGYLRSVPLPDPPGAKVQLFRRARALPNYPIVVFARAVAGGPGCGQGSLSTGLWTDSPSVHTDHWCSPVERLSQSNSDRVGR